MVTKKTPPPAPPAGQSEQSAADQYDFENILAALKEPIPADLIRQKPSHRDRNGNNVMADFIEWHTAADKLDELFPFWENKVKLERFGDIMVATVSLTIAGVTREGVGCGDANKEMGIKKAEHDGLKRAAVKFGLARELYHKDTGSAYEETAGSYQDTSEQGFPTQPAATSATDQITVKQVGMINARCQQLGIDSEAEAVAATGYPLGQLNKKAASALIEHIGRMERGEVGSFQNADGVDRSAQYDQTAAPPAAAPPAAPPPVNWPTRPPYNAPPAAVPTHSGAPPPMQPPPAGQQYNASATQAASGKQLGMISALCREQHIDQRAYIMQCFGCDETGLTKKTASEMIGILQGKQPPPTYQPPAAPPLPPPPPVAAHAAPPPPVARQEVPMAPPPPAGEVAWRAATSGQLAAIHKLAEGMGYAIEDVALEYSNQRTQDINELSDTEAANAIQLLQGS